ncbi:MULTISPECIES: S41 family peptidase [unclassified Sphingobacterium]|uniref:S41 family peptidase n=1 Tax=unclassified Sphingobacterium TaxID=2609468 RepID=UPI0025E7A114|nr:MULTISPECIES: S41 family peptidase [unclassified Sphingobacterium]
MSPNPPKMGWYSNSPRVIVDEKTRYDNHQPSLLISSTKEKDIDAFFHFSNRDIVGKNIVFHGKYKYEQAQDAQVSFSINLNTFSRAIMTEKTTVGCNGDKEWNSFSIEMPLDRTEHFYFHIISSGNIKLWISECQVEVDGQSFDILQNPTAEADKDFDFIESSNIALGSSPTPQLLENLEILGKVWGFLKYFHPQVVVGKYNWDFELFRVLPAIANAKNREERNRLLGKWIDKYGNIIETENYSIKDSTQYHRFASLNWLEDPKLFDKELSAKLVKIKNAKRNSVFNYYMVPLAWKEEVEFTRDKPYNTISWQDQGYRILTLYRLWNAIEYCFPYTSYTDNKWSSLLAKYLPEFVVTPSEGVLDRSIKELAAEINDSHGEIISGKPVPPMRGLPMSLTQTHDGKLAVSSTRLIEIDRGAEILAVNDKPVSEIIEVYRPIIPASNEKALIRNVTHKLFLTPEDKIKVSFKYNGKEHNEQVPTQTFTRNEHIEIKKPQEYSLKKKDILYMNLGEIGAEAMEKMLKNKRDAKGLILDLRNYPLGYTKDILEKYLYPEPTEYMWFSMNAKKYPGNFFLDIRGDVGLTKNRDYFKGKIAILVSETTQSLGELSAIAYRAAPRSAIIGTQSAGANGHIGYLFLPRGIRFVYTMAGAFYPNWKPNQRVGVTIDIPVKQTVEDVKDGEDVWIRNAIEYIESN